MAASRDSAFGDPAAADAVVASALLPTLSGCYSSVS
jgi:hypothetical protein